MLARKSRITFLIKKDRYKISSLAYVFQDYFEICFNNGGINKEDVKESKRVLDAVNDGNSRKFYSSYLFDKVEHLFIAFYDSSFNEFEDKIKTSRERREVF